MFFIELIKYYIKYGIVKYNIMIHDYISYLKYLFINYFN